MDDIHAFFLVKRNEFHSAFSLNRDFFGCRICRRYGQCYYMLKTDQIQAVRRVLLSSMSCLQTLSVQQLTCLAIQLANAIRYLHQHEIVHGDIATRNCT